MAGFFLEKLLRGGGEIEIAVCEGGGGGGGHTCVSVCACKCSGLVDSTLLTLDDALLPAARCP